MWQEGSESDLVVSKADAEEVAEYDGIIPLAARTQHGFDALAKAIQDAPGALEPFAIVTYIGCADQLVLYCALCVEAYSVTNIAAQSGRMPKCFLAEQEAWKLWQCPCGAMPTPLARMYPSCLCGARCTRGP